MYMYSHVHYICVDQFIPLYLQPDMYPGMRPSTYPDIPPNAISMGGAYSGGANYQGPPNPYMGAGRFPPYQRIAPPPVGMMQQAHAPASPGVTSEGEVSARVSVCSILYSVRVCGRV